MFWMIVFTLYGLFVTCLLIGWLRVVTKKQSIIENKEFISVIVPIRNESKNIEKLIESIYNQNIGKNQFELIIVDDHSTDSSIEVANNKIHKLEFTNASVVFANDFGKKNAIRCGVECAQGSIIMITDADCKHSNGWIQAMSSRFSSGQIKMVCGAVRLEADQPSLFERMQSQEFSSLVGSGASTLFWGIPTMCNGANLSFRKETFLEVGGYAGNESHPSGDDEFLLRKIFHRYPQGVIFNNSQNAIVASEPLKTLNEFVEQRIRWAGKWRAHHDITSKLMPLFLVGFYLGLVTLPVAVDFGFLTMDQLWTLLLFKLASEFFLLYSVGRWLKQRWSWISFFTWQFVYPVYALFIGILSNFKTYTWKDRKYNQMLKTA